MMLFLHIHQASGAVCSPSTGTDGSQEESWHETGDLQEVEGQTACVGHHAWRGPLRNPPPPPPNEQHCH